MTTITTRQEQRTTAAAARKVGGYSELVRLSTERERIGRSSDFQSANVHRTVKPANGTPKRG